MKIKFALAAVAAGLTCATAHAADFGPYVGLGGGLSVPGNSTPILTRPSNAPHETQTSFSAGWGAEAVAGFKLDGYRAEVEASYRRVALAHMDAGTATGNQGTLSVMGNLLFNVGSGGGFQPYIGGGVGAAFIKWHNVQATSSATLPGVLPVFDDSSPAVFQYQGIAGISFPMGATSDIFAEYHYVGTTGAKFESAALPGALFSEHKDASHNVMVGVRFSFGP
ncbi:MAG: P44/Msp2 family outer membrane protein [Rhodospirillaceae bacterium]